MNRKKILLKTSVLCMVALLPLCLFSSISLEGLIAALSLLPVAMVAGRPLVVDKLLQVTRALPAADATVTSTGIDLGLSSSSRFGDHMGELLLEAPALVVGELANADTQKWAIYHDSESDFSGEELLAADVLVQTGADGAGAAAKTARFALPSDVKRYIRVKITASADKDTSGKSGTISLVY
jgi:hypothetical protein